MSSHIRYIARCGGGYYCGSSVAEIFRQLTGMKPKTQQEYVDAAKVAGAQLWIFKEPRQTPVYRSRYKKFCQYTGIGRYMGKKKPPKVAQIPMKQQPVGIDYGVVLNYALPKPKKGGIPYGGLQYKAVKPAGLAHPAQAGAEVPAYPAPDGDDF